MSFSLEHIRKALCYVAESRNKARVVQHEDDVLVDVCSDKQHKRPHSEGIELTSPDIFPLLCVAAQKLRSTHGTLNSRSGFHETPTVFRLWGPLSPTNS